MLSTVIQAIEAQREIGMLIASSLVLGGVLLIYRPEIRPRLRRLGGFFVLSWVVQHAVVPVLRFASLTISANVLNELFYVATGLAFIHLWGLVVFRLLLPVLRFRGPKIVEDLSIAVGYVAWGLVCLRQIGLDLSQIVTTSAVITAVLAFALQDTLGNILAGLALQLDESIKAGDWVQIDHYSGRVVEINWRATRIETRNWETVVVPNSTLLKSAFSVLGKREGAPQQWRRNVTFEVNLETLPTQIISIVEYALHEAALKNVAKEPMPNCVLMSVEKGIAHYAVRYWLTDLAADDPTDSNIRALIDAALRRHGRRLSPPQYNIMMSVDNKRFMETRHKRHTRERMNALRQLDLLAQFTDQELSQLADRLRFTPYVMGDTLVQEGEQVGWLYIITVGHAEMYIGRDETCTVVGQLGKGSFFGEMCLMTGAPINYSVRATSNVECYRLDKDSFQTILLARQELAEAISLVLERRLAEHSELLRHSVAPAALPHQNEILARVRKFFALDL